MTDFNALLEIPPYSLDKSAKTAALTEELKKLEESYEERLKKFL